MKLLVLAALFACGVLTAGVVASIGNAQATDTTTATTTTTVHETTTARETTTVTETTTSPGTTVVTTATTTVAPTTTSAPATTPTTTTTPAKSASTTPAWVWVVLALLAAAVVGLAVAIFTRRGPAALPEPERRRRLQSAVDSWTAQGWALVNQTADQAVLSRGAGERMTVTVDPAGEVSARLIGAPPS